VSSDDFKQVWQSQTVRSRLTIDADLLLQEVRRNHRSVAITIFWRDVREIGISIVLIPVWLYLGLTLSLPWTWYLTVPALLWIVVYMLLDRLRQKRQGPEPGDSLMRGLESSLAQIEHQIWLLRNVFWWYLLPLAVPVLAFLYQFTLQTRPTGWLTVIVVIVFAFVYWLNQYAVRTEFEPRRQELEKLLASLRDAQTTTGC
jgi:membrane protein implicated in regulation of membrane protease activity